MSERPFASVLSFNGQLVLTDALMSSTNWDQRLGSSQSQPLSLLEKTVRGTMSHRYEEVDKNGKAKDPLKILAGLVSANIQTVDYAALPHQKDTLVVKFALKLLNKTGTPEACNSDAVSKRLVQMISEYQAEADGYSTLSLRYAANVANARWLWRNYLGAEAIEVVVEKISQGRVDAKWKFNATDIPRDTFRKPSDEVRSLGADFNTAMVQGGGHMYQVTAFVRLGAGMPVFPSQLFTRGDSKKVEENKSRHLFQIDGQAGMTSQKIGNAIRSIDTWYSDSDSTGEPIAVDPYGVVTAKARAHRGDKAQSFYGLFDKWVGGGALTLDDKHFVVAVLVRGGVFGGKE